jgi:hypothetical protein
MFREMVCFVGMKTFHPPTVMGTAARISTTWAACGVHNGQRVAAYRTAQWDVLNGEVCQTIVLVSPSGYVAAP